MTWHGYDATGWYAGPVERGAARAVREAPPIDSVSEVVGDLRARWQRYRWVVQPYAVAASAPSWTDPNLDPRYFVITGTALLDRLGNKADAALNLNNSAARAAFMAAAMRGHVDLKAPGLAPVAAALVAGGVLTAQQAAALRDERTTEAERVTKGLPQPT